MECDAGDCRQPPASVLSGGGGGHLCCMSGSLVSVVEAAAPAAGGSPRWDDGSSYSEEAASWQGSDCSWQAAEQQQQQHNASCTAPLAAPAPAVGLPAAATGLAGASKAPLAAGLCPTHPLGSCSDLSSCSSYGRLADAAAEAAAEAASTSGGGGTKTSSKSSSGSSISWQPRLAQVQAAASAPLLVAAHQGLPYQRILGGASCSTELPVNTGSPVEFETPLFQGRACIFVRGLPGAPEAVFAGRRRRTLVTVQGRFKVPAGLDDIVTGQEFPGGASRLPPAWLVEGVLLKVARTLTPSAEIGPLASPYMLMPVVAGCAEICVSLPGQEPHPAEAPREDMRLHDNTNLSTPDGSPLPPAKRKAFFSKRVNREGRFFDPELVYTLYFYQHVVAADTYHLHVVHKFDLCKHLRGQPLQLMMRQRGGPYLFCFHMWHQRLLESSSSQRR